MTDYQEYVIELQNANIVVLKAKKGYVMCGYLNIDTAERLGDAACMVTSVKNTQDALKAKIKTCTSKAKQIGIKEGMTGEEAIKKLQ